MSIIYKQYVIEDWNTLYSSNGSWIRNVYALSCKVKYYRRYCGSINLELDFNGLYIFKLYNVLKRLKIHRGIDWSWLPAESHKL